MQLGNPFYYLHAHKRVRNALRESIITLITRQQFERWDSSVEELTCKDAILGYQLKSNTKLNVGVNDVFVLYVKSYIGNCKLLNLVPSYHKLVEYIGCRMMLESNLENLFENMWLITIPVLMYVSLI